MLFDLQHSRVTEATSDTLEAQPSKNRRATSPFLKPTSSARALSAVEVSGKHCIVRANIFD